MSPPKLAFPLALAFFAALALSGCATQAPSRQPANPTGHDGSRGSPAAPGLARNPEEAAKLAAKARAAIEEGHLTEAIRSYVAVIALYRESGDSSLLSAAESAAAELARIGARLSLEPGSEWLDEKGGQLAGSSRGLGRGAASPSVHLYENFGAGKSPVADAPIHFEFIENAGKLIPFVSTDAYGRANTSLSGLESPGKPAVIRAYPVFRVRETSYAFRGIFRDFFYLPPPRVARLLVIEKGAEGGGRQSLEALLSALSPLELELSPWGGEPAGAGPFPGGEAEALAGLGSAGYLFLARLEAGAPRQLELGGRKYNIFSCEASAGLRLLRSDGSAIYALPLGAFKGQGGTGEAAAADALKLAREALVAAIGSELGRIGAAFEKEL